MMYHKVSRTIKSFSFRYVQLFFFGIMFISPMAGLLADIKFGCYKTLRCSSYVTVVAGSCFYFNFLHCAYQCC